MFNERFRQDLSIKGGHAGGVNDAASVSVRIRLVLPHLTHGEANYVEGARDVHLQEKYTDDSHMPLLVFSSSAARPSYVDDALEVLQAVRDVLLEVVGFNGDSDAGAVNRQVQLPEPLSGQGHGRLHIRL